MEQLSHVWRSFHFNENTETLYSYITHIRQVATLLGYGKPQVLEVFKNIFPTIIIIIIDSYIMLVEFYTILGMLTFYSALQNIVI